MKRSTHSDRVTAWAAKQHNSQHSSKTNISAATLLRHAAIMQKESHSADEAQSEVQE